MPQCMIFLLDTIRLSSILDLLVECGCDDDEICLVRLLLSNTKLRVNVNGTLSAKFLYIDDVLTLLASFLENSI